MFDRLKYNAYQREYRKNHKKKIELIQQRYRKTHKRQTRYTQKRSIARWFVKHGKLNDVKTLLNIAKLERNL